MSVTNETKTGKKRGRKPRGAENVDFTKCDPRVASIAQSPYFPKTVASSVFNFFFPDIPAHAFMRALSGGRLSKELLEKALKAMEYVIELRKRKDMEEAEDLRKQASRLENKAIQGDLAEPATQAEGGGAC